MRTIQLRGIEKTIVGDGISTTLLHPVTLTFEYNQFTTIVGASGSGKSTLLSLIGTLDLPSGGRIFYGNEEPARLKGYRLADFRFDNIGFVFQNFQLLPTLTALENVMAPLFPRKVPYNKTKRAFELLEQVGLADKSKLLPSQLSGGEQQRVAIARSLVNKPTWILADEPTGNLDSKNSEAVYGLLHAVNRETGCGVLMVTHDMQLALRGDRIIELKDGLVIRDTAVSGDVLC
jgi:ABC-type lipoprotein export system ATPase subunit